MIYVWFIAYFPNMYKHLNEKYIKITFCIVHTTTTTAKWYQGVATNVTVKKGGETGLLVLSCEQ